MKPISRCVFLAAAMLGAAVPAPAQQLKLSMENGRVTLVAQDVPLRQILAEWARVGDTQIVNGDKLFGPPVSLQLVDYPEGRALDILLREVAGYMAAPRPANLPGASVYDRIMILPTSKAPPPSAITAAPQPYRNLNVMQQPMPVPIDDQEDPIDQGPVPPPGMVPQGMPVPGVPPYPVGVQQQPVLTSPRPGQLPPPPAPVPGVNPYGQPTGVNPYAPPPGTIRQPNVPGRPPGGTPDMN